MTSSKLLVAAALVAALVAGPVLAQDNTTMAPASSTDSGAPVTKSTTAKMHKKHTKKHKKAKTSSNTPTSTSSSSDVSAPAAAQ